MTAVKLDSYGGNAAWGFNTIGWTQEYISDDWRVALDWFGGPIDLGHSSTPWSAPGGESPP